MVPTLLCAARTLRRSPGAASQLWIVGAILAVVAFLVHGLLDSFLAFTPTALLFWMLLGVLQKPHVSGR